MRRSLLAPLLLVLAAIPVHACAQELTLLAGGLQQSGSKEKTSAWAFEYLQPLHENIAASFSWLNEGHVPGHHRDGQSVQIWARTNVLDRRLSLAVGVGPYRYFDTTVSSAGGGYANIHGWGTVASLAATYYTPSRWLFQLRANRIVARDSIDTTALMFGVGYQLEPVAEPGPQASTPRQIGKTTTDEVSVFLGKTIVNSYFSENGTARAIEYRHGLARYIDMTVGLLNEGDARLIRRTGVTAQIWGVREVLASDRLVLGVGYGPYLAIDKYRSPLAGEARDSKLSWMFTAMAALRFGERDRWSARLSWNRTNTNYNRDTDVILLGLGYRLQ